MAAAYRSYYNMGRSETMVPCTVAVPLARADLQGLVATHLLQQHVYDAGLHLVQLLGGGGGAVLAQEERQEHAEEAAELHRASRGGGGQGTARKLGGLVEKYAS